MNMGTVLLGDLAKSGWVVLKCVYEIKNGSEQQDYFYHLNNYNFPKKFNFWNKINESNREMLYGIENYNHEQKFSEDGDIETKIPDIFQSDCDVISHHLYFCDNFDIVENKNKYYLPNVMRHHGCVDKDQVPYLGYKHVLKENTTTPVRKRESKSEYQFITKDN